MRALKRFWRARRGAAAVETAFILPGVLFLALGGTNLILLLFALVSLHTADEASARYASTQQADNSGTQPSSSTVTNFASGIYRGPGLGSLSFSYSTAGTCHKDSGGNNVGNTVSGSGTYHLYYGVGALAIPISDHVCFP